MRKSINFNGDDEKTFDDVKKEAPKDLKDEIKKRIEQVDDSDEARL